MMWQAGRQADLSILKDPKEYERTLSKMQLKQINAERTQTKGTQAHLEPSAFRILGIR